MSMMHPQPEPMPVDLDDPGEVPKPPFPFKIVGQVFRAAGSPPAGAMLDMAHAASISGETQEAQAKRMMAIASFLDTVLMNESRERFAAAMRDPELGLDMPKLNRVLKTLMEHYGGRPTVPASPYSGGQAGTGTSSMAGAPQGAWTPGHSPQPV